MLTRAGITAAQGVVPEPSLLPQSSDWWHPNAVFDLDFENGRFRVNGVTYASKPAMVTAGIYTIDAVNGDRLDVTGLLPGIYTVFAKGTTSPASAPSAPERMWELKGASTANNNSCYVYRNQTTPAIHAVGKNSSGTTQWDITQAAVAASTAISVAVRHKTNAVASSLQSGLVDADDASATIPTMTRLIIGNSDDNTRPWAGTIKRICAINEDSANAELSRLARLFTGLDSNILLDAVIEPFQMEPVIAQVVGGYLNIGYATTDGPTYVSEIDLSRKRATRTKQLHSYPTPDEHYAPIALLLTSGTSFYAGTGHGSGDLIYWRNSVSGRLSTLSAETQFSSALTAPNYLTAHQRTTSEIFLATHEDRAGGSVSNRPNVQFLRSTDTGATFALCRPFVGRPTTSSPSGGQNQIYYQFAYPSADVALAFGVWHDSNDNARFKLVEVNLSTGDVITRDTGNTPTTQGNMFVSPTSAAPILDHDSAPAPWAKASGKKQIELILQDDGLAALLQEVDNATSAAHSVLKLKLRASSSNPFDPAAWSSVDVPFGTYYSDACFAREPHSGVRIYFTWNDAGTYRLTRAQSNDNGATWTYVNLLADALELRRPVSPVGATANFPVFCDRFTSRIDFANFASDLVWP